MADDPLEGLPYRALRRLGEGGTGEVLLAQHRQLGKLCVAKILHSRFANDPRVADRIRLEAQSLGRLNHPHIISIIGAGKTADGRPFLITEYLRGETLAGELAVRGPLPVIEALSYSCQLLKALAAAHALGIVHRDIKPENLFLCDGSDHARTLKVLDFGVARILPDASSQAPQPLAVPTDTGLVVGTPKYVSPEGAVALPVDHRADLYAAALVLYFSLAGRGPFDHIHSDERLLSAHARREPEPPSRFAREPIPPELDRLILRALRKDPAERFQSADELRAELEYISELLQSSTGWLETSVYSVSEAAAPLLSETLEYAPHSGSHAIDAPSVRAAAPSEPPPPILQRSGAFAVQRPAVDEQRLPDAVVRSASLMTALKAALIFLTSACIAATIAAMAVALIRSRQ